MGNLREKATNFLLAAAIMTGSFACTKIDYTTVGGDLIPVVDNINTFDTVLNVITTNYIPEDSTRVFAQDGHPVGHVSDPVFGNSTSRIFFEMKPSTFPFAMHPKDSLVGIDSAVLILHFEGYYGDSLKPVNLKLYQVSENMERDTSGLPIYSIHNTLSPDRTSLIGEKTVNARSFKDSITLRRGTTEKGKVVNQLRIPVSAEWASFFFSQDSVGNGAYKSDSLFKRHFKGFALEAEGTTANTILYFNLLNPATGLTFYYRQKNGPKIDTTSKTFVVGGLSAHAAQINTVRDGADVLEHLGGGNSSDRVYLQTAPNVSARIDIPGLAALTNRVVHRAELRVTELNPSTTDVFQKPNALYLDVVDTAGMYRGIPYDLSPFSSYYCYPAAGIAFGYFGGVPKIEEIQGESLNVFRFNITRYLQSFLSKNERLFEGFRLSVPYTLDYEQCANNPSLFLPRNLFPFLDSRGASANLPLDGRIIVAGGNHNNPEKRMQLRIVYSKIK